jgi:dGTPase
MFSIDDLGGLPLIGDLLAEIAAAHPALEPSRRAHELVRRLITRMIEDVIAESRRRLVALAPRSVATVRQAAGPVVAFSPDMAAADRAIKDFLYPRLYRHARIMRIMGEAEELVRRLFDHYRDTPADLPPGWLDEVSVAAEADRAVRIADYIAGMTDRFVMVEHTRIFSSTPELR